MPRILAVAPSPDDLLSAAEAGALLGRSDETLRSWAAQKKIAHIRYPSGIIRFRRSDIEAILEPIEPAEAAS